MNNNKIKKIISTNLILISILSIFTLNQKSLATIKPEDNKRTITVFNIEQGVTVTITQLATIDYGYSADQAKDNYEWKSPVKEWVEKNYPEYLDTAEFYKKVKSNSNEAASFYQKIQAAINKGEIGISASQVKIVEGTPSTPVDETKLTGKAEFQNVRMGTYLVTIQGGYMVYEPSIVNLIPTYDEENKTWVLENQDVVVKATSPSITKSVTAEGKIADNYNTFEEINYIIKADVPAYSENSLSKKIYIADKMDNSLEICENTFAVYGVAKDGTETGISCYSTKYNTKIPQGEEDVSVLLYFNYDEIKSYKTIKVTYNAKLKRDSNLVVGSEGNNNYAYLVYASNPYDSFSLTTQKSNKISVFTYGLDLKVVDKDDENIALDDTTFIIGTPEGRMQRFVKEDDGVYYLAGPYDDVSAITTTLVTDKDGKICIKGLDEGTFLVIQEKAKDGYTISAKEYSVEIKDEDLDGNREENCELIIKNSKGYSLPVTGGNGIIALISLGTVLIGIAIALIISINKKKKIIKENM